MLKSAYGNITWSSSQSQAAGSNECPRPKPVLPTCSPSSAPVQVPIPGQPAEASAALQATRVH